MRQSTLQCFCHFFLSVTLGSIGICGITSCATASSASTSHAGISHTSVSTTATTDSLKRFEASSNASAPPTVISAAAQPALLMGQLTWEDWKKNARWSRYDAPNYNPSSVFTQRIEEDMSTGEISFLLFAGSWCEDSQTELPRLFKLLEASNVPSSKVQIHGVDENKHDLAGLSQKYGIYKVPTLIALKNGRELGRIIEHPRTSWELDVIVIIER